MNTITEPNPKYEHAQDSLWDGLCPVCHSTDGYLNVGKQQYHVYHEHKKWWWGDYGMNSSWQMEDEATWAANKRLLLGY